MPNVEQSKLQARSLLVALEISLASLIGFGLLAIGLGSAAWILSGIAAGAIVYFGDRPFDPDIQPNRNARKAGQLIVGLSIGLSLPIDRLANFASQSLILLGLPIFLMVAGGAIGVLYSRLEKIDLMSGLLATTPGNIGVMSSLAADYGNHIALVSLVQLMRFTTVIFSVPLIANVALPNSTHTVTTFVGQALNVPWQTYAKSSLMITIAVVIVHFATQLNIPLAAFFGAIAVGLGFEFLSILDDLFHVDYPIIFNVIGQILLGITIGEYWGINPRLKFVTVLRAIVPVGMMLIAGLIAAAIIHALTHLSWLSCLLMAAPGGSPEMIAIALTLQQDPEIITIAHIIRLLTINLSLPILLGFAAYQTAHQPSDSSPRHTSKSSSSK
ncbi:AbrB family transcriptional regulator [Leptolyngbya sp. AN03gr2]|uniref:AbrB family transcriptional regulator n=1 Tax=Leptolyngbya sp. AN03gr2 TaxID=3423364 RepID=UPI003D3177E3